MHFQRESSEMKEVPKYAFEITKYADERWKRSVCWHTGLLSSCRVLIFFKKESDALNTYWHQYVSVPKRQIFLSRKIGKIWPTAKNCQVRPVGQMVSVGGT